MGRDELVEFVDGTTCPVGHDVHWASLSNGLLEQRHGDALALSAGGGDWLVEYGRPSPDWAGSLTSPGRRCATGRRGRYGRGATTAGVASCKPSPERASRELASRPLREALSHDFSVVVVVPTIDLVEQWVKTLRRAKIDSVGVSADGQRATFSSHAVVVGPSSPSTSSPLAARTERSWSSPTSVTAMERSSGAECCTRPTVEARAHRHL